MKRAARIAWVFACFGIIAGTTAATVRYLPTPQTSKGSIEGVAARSDTNAPWAGVQVQLIHSGGVIAVARGAVPIAPVSTDGEGKFAFRNLEPGSYYLSASASGSSPQYYHQTSSQIVGQLLTLAAGQAMTGLIFNLRPNGIVRGRITNAAGEPLSRTLVALSRPQYLPSGERIMAPLASGQSTDLGEYAVSIAPGRYYLSVQPLSALYGSGNLAQRIQEDMAAKAAGVQPCAARSNPGTDLDYQSVYYPATGDISQAIQIDVTAATEFLADIRVRLQPTFRVCGQLLDAKTNRPPPAATLILNPLPPDNWVLRPGLATYIPSTGSFEFRGMMPGKYSLQATVVGTPGATVQVAVSQADVKDIVVTVNLPAVSIPGVIRLAGALAAGMSLNGIQVTLEPTLFPLGRRSTASVSPGGAFTLTNVSTGDYSVGVGGSLPPNTYVSAVRLGQRNLLTEKLSVTGPVADTLQVDLRENPGQINGTVVVRNAQPLRDLLGMHVVLVPDSRERVGLYRSVETDRNGRFIFPSVVPGNYKVFAWDSLAQWSYFDPVLLQRYDKGAIAIQIVESSRKTVSVDLMLNAEP